MNKKDLIRYLNKFLPEKGRFCVSGLEDSIDVDFVEIRVYDD